MIDSYFRDSYQKVFVDPVLRSSLVKKLSPQSLTLMGCFIGIMTGVFLWLDMSWIALGCLLASGYFDTLDGSVARIQNLTSDTGAVLDIVSDRLVEWSVILGLFLIDPIERGLLCILMLGSILLCITSFLVVGVFSENESQKSFHYSPGLIERSEAFFFFGLMILFPLRFELFSVSFSLLVFLTSLLRVAQFLKYSKHGSQYSDRE